MVNSCLLFCCSFMCSLFFFQNPWLKLFYMYIQLYSIFSWFNYLTFDCKNDTLSFFYKLSLVFILLFLSEMNISFLSIIYFLSSFCNQNDFLLITYVFHFCETCLLCVFCIGLCLCSVLLSFFSIFSASSGNISFLPAFDQVISPSLSV